MASQLRMSGTAPYAGGNYTCKRRRAKSLTFRGPSFGASLSPEGGTIASRGAASSSSLQFSTDASEEDRKEGARIFHERCSVCHGVDGSGTPFAPSLTRSQYNHGDSDLAIYKVLRDGIPGTGMQSAGLTLLERLQVISHLKSLQGRTVRGKQASSFPLGDPREQRTPFSCRNQSRRVAHVFRFL